MKRKHYRSILIVLFAKTVFLKFHNIKKNISVYFRGISVAKNNILIFVKNKKFVKSTSLKIVENWTTHNFKWVKVPTYFYNSEDFLNDYISQICKQTIDKTRRSLIMRISFLYNILVSYDVLIICSIVLWLLEVSELLYQPKQDCCSY